MEKLGPSPAPLGREEASAQKRQEQRYCRPEAQTDVLVTPQELEDTGQRELVGRWAWAVMRARTWGGGKGRC